MRACLLLVAVCAVPQSVPAYAVYTHAELIDLLWLDSIQPLLEARYPGATPAELRDAHAFAYGGCTIQDIGYYPFGKRFFSDITHYVRSGDFVVSLLRHARNRNDLAFAIGALSHYIGDSIGHSIAVNPAAALTFPEAGAKYGPFVTYQQDPVGHVRTETGFDVAQIAWHRYAPRAYRRHIGFRVSRALLDRAFFETYGLTVRSVLGPERSALGSYRFAVRKLMPKFLVAEVVILRNRLPREAPTTYRQEFLARIARTEYATRWGNTYGEPGCLARLLAIVIRIIPKIGILKILSVKPPSAETEDLFLQSVDTATTRFRNLLATLAAGSTPLLADRDLDTGDTVKPGAYIPTDRAYAELLSRLAAEPDSKVLPALKADILAYYADPDAPISTRKNAKAWAKVQSGLERLRTAGN